MPEEYITLDADGQVQLPTVDVLTGRAFLTGKSGAGKSNSASVIAEELLDQSLPLLIVDTDGEYWGLKEKYEILHAGADEECDIQVGPEHGEKLATLALEQNVPIILDVSGYIEDAEAKALIREVAHHLFTKEKHLKKPFLLMVEEVHEYIPEGGGMDEAGEMLVKVGKRGRKRGLGIIGISQRPADVKKDFITQANWILWHRLTWDNDTEVVRRVVDREHAEAVAELADGEAFLQADFLAEDIRRVQVRRKATFDAGATPDLGEIETPDLKSVGDDLLGELAEISEQKRREEDRIAELEAMVEAREEEIGALQDELERARDMQDMAQQFTEALTASEGEGGEAIQAKVDEIREEKNQQIRELEGTVGDLQERNQQLQSDLSDASERIDELQEYEQAVDNLDELKEAVLRMNDALGVETDGQTEALRRKLESARNRIAELEDQKDRAQQDGSLQVDVLENRAVKQYLKDKREQLRKLSDTKTAMLRYFIVHGPAKAREAYKYAGNSPTSSRRKQYAGELSSAGFIQNVGTETYEYDIDAAVNADLSDGFTEEERAAIADRLDEIVQDAVFETAEATD